MSILTILRGLSFLFNYSVSVFGFLFPVICISFHYIRSIFCEQEKFRCEVESMLFFP